MARQSGVAVCQTRYRDAPKGLFYSEIVPRRFCGSASEGTREDRSSARRTCVFTLVRFSRAPVSFLFRYVTRSYCPNFGLTSLITTMPNVMQCAQLCYIKIHFKDRSSLIFRLLFLSISMTLLCLIGDQYRLLCIAYISHSIDFSKFHVKYIIRGLFNDLIVFRLWQWLPLSGIQPRNNSPC